LIILNYPDASREFFDERTGDMTEQHTPQQLAYRIASVHLGCTIKTRVGDINVDPAQGAELHKTLQKIFKEELKGAGLIPPRPVPDPNIQGSLALKPIIPRSAPAKAERRRKLKEAIEWIVASVLLLAVLLLSAIIVLNDMEETLTKPIPPIQGDG
jgi:hypothetical protein